MSMLSVVDFRDQLKDFPWQDNNYSARRDEVWDLFLAVAAELIMRALKKLFMSNFLVHTISYVLFIHYQPAYMLRF